MNNIYFIYANKLNDFINKLRDSCNVFTPAIRASNYTKETDYSYEKSSPALPFIFNPYRVIDPLKSFFTHSKEKVAEYFTPEDNIASSSKTIIFGIKACDIAAHRIQDFVFLEGVEEDSLYRLRRENIIFVSGDCIAYKEVCFCIALEILPYPIEGFDLNLSPLNDGYLVEVGSKKGEELIKPYKEFFTSAKPTQIAARKTKRDNLVERLKESLVPKNIPPKNILQRLVKEGYVKDTWQRFMLTCVECGGCNLICDTCHCFLLADQKQNQQNVKLRMWDSCLYPTYARVAGGANPLKTRTQRLRNRFMKKFDFFVDNLGIPACCGCGRCIEVCPGKIDLREVLKDLAK